jgi:hypothetical protein
LPSPEQIAKLPKWAQRHIRLLEQNLASERKRLARGPADSDTFASPYGNTPQPLGRHTLIRLALFGGDLHARYIDVRTDVDHRKQPHVYVMASDGLLIEPQSSNTVRLRLIR